MSDSRHVFRERGDVVAVIPAAGLGTRVRVIAGGRPKEMLPAGRKPLIQLAVEEAIAAGIRRIAVVIRPGKESIRSSLLEGALGSAELVFPVQPEPLGVADALVRARPFLQDQPFVMILPDQGLLASRGATEQLLAAWRPGTAIWSALVEIPLEDLCCFPGACSVRLGRRIDDAHEVEEIVDRATAVGGGVSLHAIGRTVLPPAIFDHFDASRADLAAIYRRSALPHRAVVLEGKAWDVGTTQGYRRFEFALAMSNP